MVKICFSYPTNVKECALIADQTKRICPPQLTLDFTRAVVRLKVDFVRNERHKLLQLRKFGLVDLKKFPFKQHSSQCIPE